MSETPKLPDAGHVFKPSYLPKGTTWTRAPGYCCAGVHEGGRGVGFYQCAKRSKVEREVLHHGKAVTLPYCSTHDPIKVAERDQARRVKWQAEAEERERRAAAFERSRQLREAALDAIRKIAAGHNDARALAQDVLAIFEQETE